MAEQFSSSKVIHLVLSFERYRNDLVSIINNKDIFNIGDFVLSTRISLNNQQSDAPTDTISYNSEWSASEYLQIENEHTYYTVLVSETQLMEACFSSACLRLLYVSPC